jgi:hypothetical protein
MNVNRTMNANNWAKVIANGAILTAAPTDLTVKTTALGLVHNF